MTFTIKNLLIPSRGIRRIPHLKAFLPEAEKIVAWGACDAVAGWGKKPTSLRARAIAGARKIPYLALEDGFLRSHGLGVDGAPPLSVAVDRTGVYYDSTAPSDLEIELSRGISDTALLDRAKTAMDWLRAERLSKYNKGLAPYDGAPIRRLIIDQTAGDASVILSGAAENAFETMIADALASGAASTVAVKLHPDTLKGKKGGYLLDLARRHGLRLIDAPVNPWDLLAATDEVATISSQLGFEALMAGRKVHCYGLPFYAGWGLTEDRIFCARRAQKRTVAEIFAAAYILYPRYIDPFTGEASTLEETIGLLSDIARQERKAAGPFTGIGFSPWKQWFLPNFTGGRKNISFRRGVKKAQGAKPLIWASRHEKLLKEGALPANASVARMEDGFVRSRGLGVKLTRPWSLVLDERGIYYDPRTPSDLEHILQTAELPEGLLRRAGRVRGMLLARNLSKYNTGAAETPQFDSRGRPVVLVPGQVEDDASIMTGTDGVRTNLDLLKAVRDVRPEAYVIYKPHPDVEEGKRQGRIPDQEALLYCDKVLRGGNIASLWPVIDELHTMTSLSGFEALLREKQVYTYGKPFYAGWGLTQDHCAISRRTRKLSLNALIAGTLILYPLYFDWKTGHSCNIETVIRRLTSGKTNNNGPA